MRRIALRRLHAVVFGFSMLLVAAVMAVSLPAQAQRPAARAGVAKGMPPKAKVARRAPAIRVGRELPELRSRTSKTFVGRNGRRVARVYAGPVHFRDSAGRWQDIDSRLKRQGSR